MSNQPKCVQCDGTGKVSVPATLKVKATGQTISKGVVKRKCPKCGGSGSGGIRTK